MRPAATGPRTVSHRRHVKPGSGDGSWNVIRARIAVMSASDVRQYGHVAPSTVSEIVVR